MKYNTIKCNDIANGEGIGVSIFLQGCERHCFNCFNPETWNFDGGQEFTQETLNYIINKIAENGIKRHLSILGGEPLHPDNLFLTNLIITEVRKVYPNIKIYLWTGYLYKELVARHEKILQNILNEVDVLIDGPYIEEQRDITLEMRGSKNQQIYNLKELR